MVSICFVRIAFGLVGSILLGAVLLSLLMTQSHRPQYGITVSIYTDCEEPYLKGIISDYSFDLVAYHSPTHVELNGTQLPLSEVRQAIIDRNKTRAIKGLLLTADAANPYGEVMQLMDVFQRDTPGLVIVPLSKKAGLVTPCIPPKLINFPSRMPLFSIY